MNTETQSLTHENLIPSFLADFPQFREMAEKEKKWWWNKDNDGPMSHIFFGNILNPFLVKQLSTFKNKRLLYRIFNFLELMANSKDEDVVGVLYATILEYLGDDKKILKRARFLMGEKSLELSHKVERGWGRE
jgi:hypothetical protein